MWGGRGQCTFSWSGLHPSPVTLGLRESFILSVFLHFNVHGLTQEERTETVSEKLLGDAEAGTTHEADLRPTGAPGHAPHERFEHSQWLPNSSPLNRRPFHPGEHCPHSESASPREGSGAPPGVGGLWASKCHCDVIVNCTAAPGLPPASVSSLCCLPSARAF